MADDRARQYTPEEAEEILRRALQRPADVGLSRDDLVAAAREVGVSEEALLQAADEVERGRAEHDVTARLKTEKREGLVRHVSTYAMVSVGLFLLNLMTNMATVTDQVPRWWSLFPLVGWGLAVAIHAVRSLRNPEPDAEEVRREVALEAAAVREREREDARRAREPGVGDSLNAEAMLSRLGNVLQPAPAADPNVRVRVEPPRQAVASEVTEAQPEGVESAADEHERR